MRFAFWINVKVPKFHYLKAKLVLSIFCYYVLPIYSAVCDFFAYFLEYICKVRTNFCHLCLNVELIGLMESLSLLGTASATGGSPDKLSCYCPKSPNIQQALPVRKSLLCEYKNLVEQFSARHQDVAQKQPVLNYSPASYAKIFQKYSLYSDMRFRMQDKISQTELWDEI